MPDVIPTPRKKTRVRIATRCSTIAAAAMIYACAQERPRDNVHSATKDVKDTIVSLAPPESQPLAPTQRYMNAAIVTDTLISEPRVDSRDSTLDLYLPTAVVRILYDSLPGLKVHELVIGDFNGDSRRDIAIDADASGTSAFLIVLSKCDSVQQPQLFFAWKGGPRVADLYTHMALVHPQEFPGDGEMTGPYTLRTDAVLYGYEMAASIYFIEKGELHSYSVAD